ncbi:hypothetical protein Nepgr_033857 [Nepenthes gracilis]|uniref:Uncharacterized protein n=1 Tax=Nepenthes gracilis TaxID=150966 RepID=A0AAD3TLE5_NEPGR|nr:hypothetical protein Nepgr_033857 [Nepenthes gracilis]
MLWLWYEDGALVYYDYSAYGLGSDWLFQVNKKVDLIWLLRLWIWHAKSRRGMLSRSLFDTGGAHVELLRCWELSPPPLLLVQWFSGFFGHHHC